MWTAAKQTRWQDRFRFAAGSRRRPWLLRWRHLDKSRRGSSKDDGWLTSAMLSANNDRVIGDLLAVLGKRSAKTARSRFEEGKTMETSLELSKACSRKGLPLAVIHQQPATMDVRPDDDDILIHEKKVSKLRVSCTLCRS